MAAYQYIYMMKNVSKIYPGGREIMKNITLAFLPGAKIGVLGINGAGKSTLLKIMAGIDQDIGGEAWAAQRRQGRLPLAGAAARPGQGRAGQRHGGRRPAPRPCSTGSTRSPMGFGDPDADMDALLAEQAELQEKIDACNGWELERTHRDRHGRAALPAGRRRRDQALGRRAAPRRPVPAAAVQPRHAAARRADQPSRRGIGGVARAVPGRVQEHRRGRDPRPLLPGQCRGLDPRARSRPRHPLRGQLHRLARAEEEAARAGGARGARRASAPWRASRSGSARARRRGAPSPRRASRPTRTCWPGARPGAGERPDRDPARAAPGRPGDRGRGRDQGASATGC